MNDLDERVPVANKILKQLGSKSKISNVEEINCQFLLSLYRLLFNNVPTGVVENINDANNDILNIKLLLKSLSKNILHVSLGHIDCEKVARGVPADVMNVLEIFQGLADCVQRQQEEDNRGSLTMDTRDYDRLKGTIIDTNMRVDNVTMMVEQVVDRSGGLSNREQYLQCKIEELLGRCQSGVRQGSLYGGCLQQYVDEEYDRVIIMRDQCANTYKPDQLSQTRKTHNIISKKKHNDGRGCMDYDEDLTIVTHNDGEDEETEDNLDDNDVSHGSKDTYVLSSRPTTEDTRLIMDQQCKMKNSWAQVNKDLIQNGYENEFLEMLLQEEDNVNRDKKIYPPLEDDHMAEDKSWSTINKQGIKKDIHRTMTPRRSVPTQSCGSFVRPIVRHIGQDNHDCSNNTMRSGSSTLRSDGCVEEEEDMMTQLLRQFPGLSVSEQTLRQMWAQAARQAANIQRVQQQFISHMGPGEQRVEDARRRQRLLLALLRKEALHQARLRDRVEERESQFCLKASKDKQRQQSAKARRYYDEFSHNMRARMLQKQAREEQVFRTMFNATLKLQRERINELRRYARDKKNEKLLEHERDLDSVENYYRDRFSMLADCLRAERRQLRLQDKSQEQSLQKQRHEVRLNLEKDIRLLQESMVRSDHETYFRDLDAGNLVSLVSRK